MELYLCCPDIPSWRGQRQLSFCLERALLLRLRPIDTVVCKRVVSLWTLTIRIIVPLYLLADCMGLKKYAKPYVSHLAYKSRSPHPSVLHAIARKWHKIGYGRNVLSRPHTVGNIAAVRALGLCSLLIAPQSLMFI